jgi:hypothetical protein
VIPPTGCWYPLNDLSRSDLFQSGGKFLRFLGNTFTIVELLLIETLVEYLMLAAGFYEVGPEECLRGAYSNGEKGVRCAR